MSPGIEISATIFTSSFFRLTSEYIASSLSTVHQKLGLVAFLDQAVKYYSPGRVVLSCSRGVQGAGMCYPPAHDNIHHFTSGDENTFTGQ